MADERSARVEFTGAARAGGGTGSRARLRGVWGNPSGFESRVAHSNSPSFPQREPPSGRVRSGAVDIAWMGYSRDDHEPVPVVDAVDNAVITDADSKVVT